MPSYKDLKAIITMNIIKDNQISHDNINQAQTVFGKSMGKIKGKTSRQNKKHEDTKTINVLTYTAVGSAKYGQLIAK